MKRLLLALALLGVSAYAMHNNMNAGSVVAFAETDNTNVSINCATQTITADSPTAVNFQLNWSGSTPTTTMTLSGPVNSDAADSDPYEALGATSGILLISVPMVKTDYLDVQCQNIDKVDVAGGYTGGAANLEVGVGTSESTFGSTFEGGSALIHDDKADLAADGLLDGRFRMTDDSKYLQAKVTPIGNAVTSQTETVTFTFTGGSI